MICHCAVHHYPEGVVGPRLLHMIGESTSNPAGALAQMDHESLRHRCTFSSGGEFDSVHGLLTSSVTDQLFFSEDNK